MGATPGKLKGTIVSQFSQLSSYCLGVFLKIIIDAITSIMGTFLV